MSRRVAVDHLAAGPRTLDPGTSHYLARVLRQGQGDEVVLFDPRQQVEATATIEVPNADGVRVSVGALRAGAVLAAVDLVLVYALAKGDKVDAVVRDATELGATRIVVTQTERSVVQLSDGRRMASKKERWARVAEQAARQCGRADPPAIDGILRWSEALAAAAACDARFCLDPRATTPLGDVLPGAASAGASIAIAVGPEGGLSPGEVDAAVTGGWIATSFGPFVLRTETVPAAILGAIRVLTPGAVERPRDPHP
jgi:16S rRNA (uracil1498-N3)-methyltransferase